MSDTFVRESPITMVEGETRVFTVTWEGATTVATPLNTCFAGNKDVSATTLSGNTTVSGIIQTSKIFTALKGGMTYVINFTATADGNKRTKKLLVHCTRPGDRD
jgi:hypothetical protein